MPARASIGGEPAGHERPRSTLDNLIRAADEVRQSSHEQPVSDLLRESRVLITGAGGTIGSELARQICALQPALLILVDISEHALVTLRRSLSAAPDRVFRIIDIRRREAVMQLFDRETPDFVFHAAALKHVDVCEENIAEAILTNCVGTRHVADAAIAVEARAALLASTDKAVNPVGVLGRTKWLAERFWQSRSASADASTQFVSVRFGNVLGSSGSVYQLFRSQIARGEPLTVTDPDMRRYFITCSEAVELVLAAIEIASRAPHAINSHTFMLQMSAAIRIADLAEHLLTRCDGAAGAPRIVFTGSRPGERLVEELVAADEILEGTDYPSVFRVLRSDVAGIDPGCLIDELETLALSGSADDAARLLTRISTHCTAHPLPEHVPKEGCGG